MRTQAPLLAPVFRSDGQARLLAASLLTGEELSISELAQRAGLAYPTAHREVERLLSAGIFGESKVGRTRIIRANPASPLVGPLREILSISAGPVLALRAAMSGIDGVSSVSIYGSFAARMSGVPGESPQDIDVLVVGDPAPQDVFDACDRVEADVHRPINPTILSRAELSSQSGFLETVRSRPVVHVWGEEIQ